MGPQRGGIGKQNWEIGAGGKGTEYRGSRYTCRRRTAKEEQGQRCRDREAGMGEQYFGVTYSVLCSELLVLLTTTVEVPLLITTTPTLYKTFSNYILKYIISVFTQWYFFFPLWGLEQLLTQHCHIH